MSAKPKITAAGILPRVNPVRSPVWHDVTNPLPSVTAASRLRMLASEPTAGPAKHSPLPLAPAPRPKPLP
jgi:hypothetical protein